jgi:cytochrome c556
MQVFKSNVLTYKGWAIGFMMTAGVVLSADAQQFSKPEDALKYRKSVFVVMGNHFAQLGAMAQGKVPFDAKVAADNAALVESLSKLPWNAFIEGSDKGETRAKPEVWTDGAKFKDAQARLTAETAKLALAAKTGKVEDLKVAFGGVGEACKGCHDSFRAK